MDMPESPYCLKMMECAFQTRNSRPSCWGVWVRKEFLGERGHRCLCLYWGDPSNLGKPHLAPHPDSMGPTLVFFFFFNILLIYLFGCAGS